MLSSSCNSRNCHPLRSEFWKIIFHNDNTSLHLLFLLKFHDNLHGYWRIGLKAFISLLTALCKDQLHWLGHSQNLIVFSWLWVKNFLSLLRIAVTVIYKSTHLGTTSLWWNHLPKLTSLPSMVTTFLATCLMVVLHPSRYSVFHNGDTPIQLSLLWWSYSYQCLNTETPSISYIFCLYIRLVVTL